jgi:hypothetical protein
LALLEIMWGGSYRILLCLVNGHLYIFTVPLVSFTLSYSQYKNSMAVKYLVADESPSSPTFTPSTSAKAQDTVGSQVIHLLHQISRLRMTNLGASDKADFLDYYWERTRGYGNKRKAKTS